MSNPLVSIIIPSYNRAHLIGETLNSIIEQTYLNWECLVIDDGSTDETENVVNKFIKKDNRIQFHKRPKSRLKGANSCRNYGFELSKGDYVNWFDDDDIMHQDKLFIQVNALIKSDFHFSVCQTEIFEDNIINNLGLRHPFIYSENPFYDFLTMKIVWLTNPVLWRRVFLLKLEYLFDIKLQAAQEWEFHSRVLLKISSYHTTNSILVYNRKHLNSISYSNNKGDRRFNYFLARLKIYYLIKNNHQLKESNNYLKKYLVDYFKQSVQKKELKRTLYVYKNFIKNENPLLLNEKIALLIAIGSFYFFGRGIVLLNYIKLK